MVKLLVVMMLASAVASAGPDLELGSPTVVGGDQADTAVIGLAMVNNRPALLACYASAQAKVATLAGQMSVVLVITPEGKITGAGVSGFDPDVDACVKSVLKNVKVERLSAKLEAHFRWTFANHIETGSFSSLTGTGDISSGFDDTDIYGGLLGNEGTVGHGSGARRGKRVRTSAVPLVTIGQPTLTGKGTLDKAIVRRYIKRNFMKLTYCYEKQLLAKPELAGTVTVVFTITSTGDVAPGAKSTGITEVNDCITGIIQNLQFPAPQNGDVGVKYPFTFRRQSK